VHPLTTLPVAFVSDAILPALRSADPGWRVHSVFRQALNLEAGGRMVAIAPQAAGGLPNGIAVMGQPDFRALHVTDGAVFSGRWPAFELSEAGLRFDLARAWSWSPSLPHGTIDQRDPAVRRRTELAAVMVAARASRVGFGQCLLLLRPLADGAPWEDEAPAGPLSLDGGVIAVGVRAIEALRGALARRELHAALRAVDTLIGLGDGLTPSGDDLLIGLSAALRATGDELAEPIAEHAAARAAGSTGDVARVALEHAACGEYAERLHGVLGAIGRGDDGAVHAQVERALAWGASSGADTMLGVLVGLESSGTA
jgi:hypothetical protein